MIDTELLRLLYKEEEPILKDLLDATPTYIRPIVTQADIQAKKLIRYFTRPANDINTVTEVDKKQYQQFKSNFRFITTSIEWKIVGAKKTIILNNNINIYGVEDLNRIAVSEADLTFGGLRRYITNYLDYWYAET